MTNRANRRSIRGQIALAACALAAALLVASPAQAQDGGTSDADASTSGEESTSESSSSPPATVEGASSERAAASQAVSTLQADRAAVRRQVAAAKAARDHQYDKWALAHIAVDEATLKTNKAAMLAVQAQMRVTETEEKVTEYAVDAFMNPPAIESMAALAMSESEDASWAHDVLSISADEKGAVLDELADAEESLALRAERAARIAAEAEAAEAQSKAELERYEEQLREQQRLDAQIDQRLDAALAEAAALREIDSEAADELEAEERALADESKAAVGGTSSRSSGSSSSGSSSSGSSRSSSSSGGSSSSSGSSTPATTTTTAKPQTPSPPPSPPSGTVTWADVTKVGTFWVHRSIASNVQSLISAASAAGFSLSGGGFRDPAQQIELRQAHCGTSYYDIYQKPASQCSPPTAIPGRSMHERGLALDIKSNGALIRSRSNPAFVWLASNASRFGFYNLPSEPWHWSTNGT